MKRILSLILISSILLSSCKSWDITMAGSQNPIQPKLLTLDKRIEDLANTTVEVEEHELKLFTDEVEKNLIDPYGQKYGYIIQKRNTIEATTGFPYMVGTMFCFGIPNLFGFPYRRVKRKIEIELRVMNSKNEMIGKYSGVGEAKVSSALYYGYGYMVIDKKAFADAVTAAYDQIRPQIQADAPLINKRLKEAGPLN